MYWKIFRQISNGSQFIRINYPFHELGNNGGYDYSTKNCYKIFSFVKNKIQADRDPQPSISCMSKVSKEKISVCIIIAIDDQQRFFFAKNKNRHTRKQCNNNRKCECNAKIIVGFLL